MEKNWKKILGLLDSKLETKELESVLIEFYVGNELLRKNGIEERTNIQDMVERLITCISKQNKFNTSFNLIPCQKDNFGCEELMIGFAELGFDSKKNQFKYGFRSLMSELYPYWFNCYNNNFNIIFTTTFDRNKFEDFYLPTFNEFEKLNKKIIIIEICKDDFYIQYENFKGY